MLNNTQKAKPFQVQQSNPQYTATVKCFYFKVNKTPNFTIVNQGRLWVRMEGEDKGKWTIGGI